ncbi:unnamed protein product [Rotaria sp. Silwood2]|nr:unnamed protein product [Rotaria sp. Silwood2]
MELQLFLIFAQLTYDKLSNELNCHVILQHLNDITDAEEFLQIQAKNQRKLLIFISTYEDGTPPSAKWFVHHLYEPSTNFRVSKNELEKLIYAIFGCRNSFYNDNFNKVTKELDQYLLELGAKPLIRTELADENSEKSIYGGQDSFNEKLIENNDDDDDDGGGCKNGNDDIMDLEDMGDYMASYSLTKVKYSLRRYSKDKSLLGFVSCFFLDNQMTFKRDDYSINKHHKNSVGTSSQWKTDDAQTVCQGAMENHYKMINTFKGVSGVLLHRLTQGQRTVYRLTLAKDYNTKEIEQYAKLVELGDPDFIEVKIVTYCGDSSASHLTMANVS